MRESSLRIPGLSLESVSGSLQSEMVEKQVFIKDFPHYVEHIYDEKFYNLFKHSFLISDPAKTITSVCDKWPDFHKKEVGFVEQRQLFDRLCDQLGDIPPDPDFPY